MENFFIKECESDIQGGRILGSKGSFLVDNSIYYSDHKHLFLLFELKEDDIFGDENNEDSNLNIHCRSETRLLKDSKCKYESIKFFYDFFNDYLIVVQSEKNTFELKLLDKQTGRFTTIAKINGVFFYCSVSPDEERILIVLEDGFTILLDDNFDEIKTSTICAKNICVDWIDDSSKFAVTGTSFKVFDRNLGLCKEVNVECSAVAYRKDYATFCVKTECGLMFFDCLGLPHGDSFCNSFIGDVCYLQYSTCLQKIFGVSYYEYSENKRNLNNKSCEQYSKNTNSNSNSNNDNKSDKLDKYNLENKDTNLKNSSYNSSNSTDQSDNYSNYDLLSDKNHRNKDTTFVVDFFYTKNYHWYFKIKKEIQGKFIQIYDDTLYYKNVDNIICTIDFMPTYISHENNFFINDSNFIYETNFDEGIVPLPYYHKKYEIPAFINHFSVFRNLIAIISGYNLYLINIKQNRQQVFDLRSEKSVLNYAEYLQIDDVVVDEIGILILFNKKYIFNFITKVCVQFYHKIHKIFSVNVFGSCKSKLCRIVQNDQFSSVDKINNHISPTKNRNLLDHTDYINNTIFTNNDNLFDNKKATDDKKNSNETNFFLQ
ncbi:hypothetical protein EDEG_03197 [Edhazardia aedis USNM 41457]|uniref:Uncharacterized protein n=1 Tax=Edhazardia aedis (strain USNM 41457) TaxID=1003232 RepID=J9D496_EDHAE|nr:hypothetical protein EDEG_03197 [Edhazardia aedis USNM 41457]|eukprot:EJW02374.1 hypothetical protein EDEG_03197 [Edhazardia aedis USNM 41457]